MKDYYQLLGVPPASPAGEIKRAFRQQIARYHPDKVQHLGTEFQEMAAERAADLTEAYRILSDEGRRSEYDRAREAGGGAVPRAAAPPPAAAPAQPPPAAARPSPEPEPKTGGAAAQFTKERASRDEFLRKAVLARFRQALSAAMGDCQENTEKGFDVSCVPKAKMFGRKKGPRVLARFVTRVDAESVANAWTAARSTATASDEVCVFLIGAGMAPARELADAIETQRRQPARGAKVTLIPVDGRNWDAHIPTDAPALAKDLLTRLRSTV